MIAQHLVLLHFLGLRDAETDRLLANELLTRRRADGTWSIWFEGPADLSVTVEAYAALKLAGVDAGDATRQYIRRSGGVARTRIFTRAFLALIGQWPWRRIQPPWVWSLIMLAALGHGFEDETFARGLAGWQRFMVRDGDRLRPEACQSPIWDTALAVLALRAAGVPADDPRLQAAGSWLLGEEVTVRGDWAIRRPGLAPGGWSFEFDNDLYPDVDDTAVVALALRELDLGDDAVRRGLDWMVGLQSRSGGWGAFDADNEALWLYRLPICDFGKVTDEPSADVTAHALE